MIFFSESKGKHWKCKHSGFSNKFISSFIKTVHFVHCQKENYSLKEKAIAPGRAIIYCKAHSLVNMATRLNVRSGLCSMTHRIHSYFQSKSWKHSITPNHGSLLLSPAPFPFFVAPAHILIAFMALSGQGTNFLAFRWTSLCAISMFVCFQGFSLSARLPYMQTKQFCALWSFPSLPVNVGNIQTCGGFL